ncbi:putative reverse transcriptase domain-containing protein, partial [Tanacetum coccineum]
GFLNPKRRGSVKGVKEKGNDQVLEKLTSIPNVFTTWFQGYYEHIRVDPRTVTQADQNTQVHHNLGGSTASVSAGQGTKGPSDVQTDANLLKEDMGNVPIWVKFHNVPITAFSKDGLSAIETKLGTLLMIDSFTSVMCTESRGRLSFVRPMIELRADVELKDTIMVDVQKLVGEGFSKCTIRVKYEWKPHGQAIRGVQVGLKVGFRPTKQVYQRVAKKNGTNTSDSESELEKVFNKSASFMASTSLKSGSESGYGHNMSKNLQPICDDWDIKVRGLKKNRLYLMFVESIVVEERDSDVQNLYDEIAQLMADGGANDVSLFEDEDYEINKFGVFPLI